MAGQDALVYVCGPHVVRARDGGRTIVVDRETDRSWILDGLEATTWDLLELRYSLERIACLLAVLQHVSEGNARTWLLATIQRWKKEGILCAAEGNGRGESGDQHGL